MLAPYTPTNPHSCCWQGDGSYQWVSGEEKLAALAERISTHIKSQALTASLPL